MPTAVVCDDDKSVRAAVSVVCAAAGLEVVAETDSETDAIELVRRFGVEVLILDLSLSDGSGEGVLRALNDGDAPTTVVVFTAYGDDPARLLRLGARQVVDKPDFEMLEAVLTGLSSPSGTLGGPSDDRRFASREVDRAPTLWRSPAGVCSRPDLAPSVQSLEVGDAALAVTIAGLEPLEADVGRLLVADCRLAVAGILRVELRVQDLLHEAPEVDGFLALLRGGDARAGGAVWSRLTAGVRRDGLPGEVKGAASRVDSHGGKDAVARAVGALRTVTVGSPAFVSV